jgi:hypothetical protein
MYDDSANTAADTLISVSMTNNTKEKNWVNQTLPDYVQSRADAELVWVPVSKQGVLIVIGGVLNAEVLYPTGLSETERKANVNPSPGCSTNWDLWLTKAEWKWSVVYGNHSYLWYCEWKMVSGMKWNPSPPYLCWDDRYLQNTTGDIPPNGRALFCSTLASAGDGSSHNIYIYGGYDGQDAEHTPYDDVYILSLPSFIWTKAYTGSSTHGRSGHQCFRIFPDQMLVIGGRFKDPSICIEGGIVQLFNLSSLAFQTVYAPDVWTEYRVPDVVAHQIGGK